MNRKQTKMNIFIYYYYCIIQLTKHPATTANCFQQLPYFFSSLNILPITFIFPFVYCLLIKTWSSKLIRPIITSLYVPCTTMWKHLASSLWMNIIDFIFRLLHIRNLPTLSVLIPFRSPYTPSIDYAHLFADYENTSNDCANLFVDCANTPNDWANTAIDLVDMFDILSLDLCIPNLALL